MLACESLLTCWFRKFVIQADWIAKDFCIGVKNCQFQGDTWELNWARCLEALSQMDHIDVNISLSSRVELCCSTLDQRHHPNFLGAKRGVIPKEEMLPILHVSNPFFRNDNSTRIGSKCESRYLGVGEKRNWRSMTSFSRLTDGYIISSWYRTVASKLSHNYTRQYLFANGATRSVWQGRS